MQPMPDLEVQPEADGVAQSVKSRSETRKPLSRLAAQYAHAVRSVLPGDPLWEQEHHGDVRHMRQTSEQSVGSDPHLQRPSTSEAAALPDQDTQCARSRASTEDAIIAEAARVKAKFASVDAKKEVVLRFDFMNESDTKVASNAMFAATILGLAVLIAEFTSKMNADASATRFKHKTVSIWNVAVGGVCLMLMSAILIVFAWRIGQARWQNKIWKTRRKRNAILFFAEGAVQWLNLVFWVAPNIYLLLNPCRFLGKPILWCGWVRWTCWNTLFALFLVHAYGARTWRPPAGSRHDQAPIGEAAYQPPANYPKLYMDGPWRLQWPCLIPWALMQTGHSIAWLWDTHNSHNGASGDGYQLCLAGGALPDCGPQTVIKDAIYLTVVVAILYFLLTLGLLLYKLRTFREQPYAHIQVAVVFYRLQLRLRATIMVYFTLCLLLLWCVRINSCASFQFSWLGIMPMQLVATANAFVWTFIAMPHLPQDYAVAMRVWAQEVAWTEADKPIKLSARALTIPNDHKLSREPIFCFETMMHMLYWSCLVYDHKRGTVQHQRRVSKLQQTPPKGMETTCLQPQQQAAKTTLDLRTALSLYSLTDSHLFWELQRDTRCLLGWNDTTIVVAFRGTASMTNALSDIQAWRVAHPPARGHTLCGTRPLVHVGFMRSWLAGGFNEKVINHIMELVNKRRAGAGRLKIYVTGHSLGGALATLAAYDIRQELVRQGQQEAQVACYSFGAPRCGNHAFARDYNHVVPDTWSIINDQDVVTRGGKFLFLYKRPGKRVIVNDFGHFMIAPNSIEASIQQSAGGQSVDHHFLTSYHHAILSIILAQFGPKGLPDGMQGIIKLAQASPYFQDLLANHMGMHLDSMQRFADTSFAERSSACLPDARLPKRGFYRIKSVAAGQLQKRSAIKPPSLRILSCFGPIPGKAGCSHALSQTSTDSVKDSELVSKASLDSVAEDVENLGVQRHAESSPVTVPLDV